MVLAVTVPVLVTHLGIAGKAVDNHLRIIMRGLLTRIADRYIHMICATPSIVLGINAAHTH